MATKSKIQNNKKVVVKKRTAELTPSKASATAIASQALRAKKQWLKENESQWFWNNHKKDSTKIPTWIWIFFGCSLFLFCVSIYQSIFKPQIESNKSLNPWETYRTSSFNEMQWWTESDIAYNDDSYANIFDNSYDNYTDNSYDNNFIDDSYENSEIFVENNEIIKTEQNLNNSNDTILEFFDKISNKDFEWVNNLLYGPIKTSSEIKEHFSEFRLSPFISWIVWNTLTPTNIQYISTSPSWNETYKFNLSYSLNNGQNFEESWTIITKNVEWDYKIISIKCETYRCSFHPIFWPENFWLM